MKENDLPTLHRFVTDHNDEGKAIFHKSVEEVLPFNTIPNSAAFGLGYATAEYPVDMNNDADIKTYKHYQQNPPGIVIPGGSVLRIVDSPPGGLSPMHRTVSLDYGVVLQGEFELILDSGEVRTMKQGDVAVQRGTMHAWKNTSSTHWGRMLYVLQESKPLVASGKELDEDYGNLEGVRASGK
jgi:quercetin dioxygenase-like cupin family protein